MATTLGVEHIDLQPVAMPWNDNDAQAQISYRGAAFSIIRKIGEIKPVAE